LSLIEAGHLTVNQTRVRVATVAEEAVRMAEPVARARDVRLTVAGDAGVYVTADQGRLRQVLMNLLNNAVKYNRDRGGRVALRWTAHEDQVRITVEDNGAGIPEGLREAVWEAFNRPDASVRAIEGSGIGLSLVRGLVTLMGGTVDLTSDVGLGSTFEVLLPACAAPALEEATQSVPATAAAGEGQLRLLVIEDHPVNQRIIRRVVETAPAQSGAASARRWTILEATTGPEGVAAAIEHAPHLILLDLHLPGFDGQKVLDTLQADPRTSEIPVAINSADEAGGQAAHAAGARAFLRKPLDIGALRGLLAEVAREVEAA
jgi:CheY-like chemotaxis protein